MKVFESKSNRISCPPKPKKHGYRHYKVLSPIVAVVPTVLRSFWVRSFCLDQNRNGNKCAFFHDQETEETPFWRQWQELHHALACPLLPWQIISSTILVFCGSPKFIAVTHLGHSDKKYVESKWRATLVEQRPQNIKVRNLIMYLFFHFRTVTVCLGI